MGRLSPFMPTFFPKGCVLFFRMKYTLSKEKIFRPGGCVIRRLLRIRIFNPLKFCQGEEKLQLMVAALKASIKKESEVNHPLLMSHL